MLLHRGRGKSVSLVEVDTRAQLVVARRQLTQAFVL